jgi:hypothetical protein
VTPPVSEIAQQRTVRLIPTAYYKPPVLQALADSDEDLSILEELEAQTSRRLTDRVPAGSPDFEAWGRTYISAAFSYRRKGGNRFNDETRGAWYAGFNERTSLEEVAYHKTRELKYINYFHDDVQYSALHASFIGRFHDLRSINPAPACLDPDIAVGYPKGQNLSNSLISTGSRGLVYPSVRHDGGACLVAFQSNAVQDVTPGACWRIIWNGAPKWSATTI